MAPRTGRGHVLLSGAHPALSGIASPATGVNVSKVIFGLNGSLTYLVLLLAAIVWLLIGQAPQHQGADVAVSA